MAGKTLKEPPAPIYEWRRKTRALQLLVETVQGRVVQVPRKRSSIKYESFELQGPDGNWTSISKPYLVLYRLGYVKAGEPGDFGRRVMEVTEAGMNWMRNPTRHQ